MFPVPGRAAAIAAALMWSISQTAPAQAGVDKSAVTVDSTIIYLGVVPAAMTRGSADPMGGGAMGGPAVNNIHNIHLVVALFDHGTRKRITDANVSARFVGERGRRWSAVLKPMIVNGAASWGAYSNMGADEKASILIDVVRPFGSGTQTLTARFEYSHD